MSSRAARADRATARWLLAGFWLPLAVCTWMAMSPSPPQPVFHVSDIVLHALAFSYLTFAAGLAYPAARPRALVMWMLAYGLTIEIVQSFEKARSAELKDLIVDGVGIAFGLVLLAALGPWSRRTLRTLLRQSLGD